MTYSKCPLSSTFIVYLLMLVLLQVRYTSGEENYKNKECVEKLDQMMDVLRSGNKHFGIRDYFGNPLDIKEIFNFLKRVKVFHFKMINATSQNNTVLDIEKPCCQWNTKDCDIFVWYCYYYYLALPPFMLHFIERDSIYLPQSLCLTIPTLCHPSILHDFATKVMNDQQGVFFSYVPMWYEGKPYGLSLYTLSPVNIEKPFAPSSWTFTLAKNIAIVGVLLLGNLLMIRFIRSENKIFSFVLNQSQKRQTKRLTEIKLFTWCLSLLLISYYFGSNLQCTLLLMSHEEYYPEIFLPDSVIALMIEILMFIIFIGQYPLIYRKIGKYLNDTSNNQQQISPRWRRVIRCHAVSLGWAGPLYSIQVIGVVIVYLGMKFIDSPLETITYTFWFILLLAAIVVILHEVYLMLRHPKNCCICSNYVTIFFCIALVFIYTGLSLYAIAILRRYRDISSVPLFDSTKLMEYVISTLLVAGLGYFGKRKMKDWYEAGNNNEDERREDEDVNMLPY